MTELDKLLSRFPLPTWQLLSFTVVAMLVASGVWATQARLDRIATAPGFVVPLGSVRTVQHLEGGLVTEIRVKDGDKVKEGQILLNLDLASGGLKPEEIQVQLDGLRLRRARLMAHVANVDLLLPEAEARRQEALASAERSAHANRRRQQETNLRMLQSQRDERRLELQSLNTRLASAKRNLSLLLEQLEMARDLSEKRLLPRMQTLDRQRETEQLRGEIAAMEIAVPLARAVLAESKARIQHERSRFVSDAAAELRDVESEIARNRQALKRAEEQARRTEVVSPIDGIVQNLRVTTIGGVVGSGEPIVDIVPSEERLVLEARLEPDDIGHVRVGDPATVKVSTYDFLRYGGLEGWVSHVAADTSIDESGQHYFKILIETVSDLLIVGDRDYPISPGMKAQIDIHIGTRPVIDYLLQPVLKLRGEAFRER